MKLATRILLAAGLLAYATTAVLISLSSSVEAQISIGGEDTLTNPVVSGVMSLADGTISAPSLTNTGDTDTGIHFPAANTVAFAAGGEDLGEWHIATGTLTKAQIRRLFSTPVEIIGTPGVGKAIYVESVQWMFDYGGTALNSVGAGEDISLQYENNGVPLVNNCDSDTTCLAVGGTVDFYGSRAENTTSVGRLVPNAAVDAYAVTGDWATVDQDADGVSEIHYLVRYRVVTVDLS